MLTILLSTLGLPTLVDDAASPTREMPTRTVRVVDEADTPIVGAEVRVTWFNFGDGSSTLWRTDVYGPVSSVTTGDDGLASVRYPAREQSTGGQVTRLGLEVRHADFVATDASVDASGKEEARVAMAAGTRLVIDAQTPGGRLAPADALVLQFVDGFAKPVAGKVTDDGLTIGPISPGEGLLVSSADGSWVSPVVRWSKDRTQPVRTQLRTARAIRGHLAETVPRPVTKGWVETVPVLRTPGGTTLALPPIGVPVAADGTFEVRPVHPDADLQLTAICEGYASAPPTPEEFARWARRFNTAVRPSEGSVVRVPRLIATAASGADVNVPMRPTVDVRLRLLDRQGEPAEGVTLSITPNTGGFGVGSRYFAGGGVPPRQWSAETFGDWQPAFDWEAVTDADGRAVIRNAPAGADIVSAVLGDWRDGTAVDLELTDDGLIEVSAGISEVTLRLAGP